MRLRSTLAAAVGALALLVSVPGSASAAEGEFTYVYTDIAGKPRVGGLVDPESLVCVMIPEAAGEYVPPAHTPRNHTTAAARVFTGPDCDGEEYTLRPGGSASERLKLRSVIFLERF
ncbi:hypothetical protein [Streptomyces sp. 35G-GA-8]|uniref:hypothetical protein n=1 Tax=Streptomyces sp. 35G-GA-8 TaxID=2939434 RepID=UPI00201EDB5E|nr:hypothetical protein [Streptomyces sp. 35G-GA-8]MCL7378611.1 hypothetical protein [Streptomyces sp. 35G-GA-8]